RPREWRSIAGMGMAMHHRARAAVSGWAVLAALAAIALSVVAACLAGGCRPKEGTPQPPPALVTVSRPIQREVIEWDEYTGNLEAPETVNLRARVSGMITDAPFKEGA